MMSVRTYGKPRGNTKHVNKHVLLRIHTASPLGFNVGQLLLGVYGREDEEDEDDEESHLGKKRTANGEVQQVSVDKTPSPSTKVPR